jgi:hypothetical protein
MTASYQPARLPTSHLISNPNTRFANGMQTLLSGNVLSHDPAHHGDEDAMHLEIPPCFKQLTRPCIQKSRLVSGGWSLSAFTPKADIRQRIEHVCFVPIADVGFTLWIVPV